MPQIYQIMITAATVDLHWEVKIKALEFWDKVIWEHLKDQGMIDGSFPEVTFSKECKKIIVLNENEIKKRLTNFLNELNKIGCLEVLTKAIQDDSDFEVIEKSVEVIKNIVILLKKYKMVSCVEATSICQNRVKHADFFDLIRHDLDKIVENRKKWLPKTDNFGTLLNEMLRNLDDDEDVDAMDC